VEQVVDNLILQLVLVWQGVNHRYLIDHQFHEQAGEITSPFTDSSTMTSPTCASSGNGTRK